MVDGAATVASELPTAAMSGVVDGTPVQTRDARRSSDMKKCEFCGETKHADELQQRYRMLSNNGVTCCISCACPTCATCGNKEKEPLTIGLIRKYMSTLDKQWYYLYTLRPNRMADLQAT